MNMLPVHGMVYIFRWLCNVIERGQAVILLTSQTEKKSAFYASFSMMHPKVYEGGMNMLPVHGMVYVFRWLCNVIERGQASLTSQTEKNQRFMFEVKVCDGHFNDCLGGMLV